VISTRSFILVAAGNGQWRFSICLLLWGSSSLSVGQRGAILNGSRGNKVAVSKLHKLLHTDIFI
jgi:hypothetical protein